MILLDTSGLLAALVGFERSHGPAARALEERRTPFLLSPFVLAELDYLLSVQVGPAAETTFLGRNQRHARTAV